MRQTNLIALAMLLALSSLSGGCDYSPTVDVDINIGEGEKIKGSGEVVRLELDFDDFTRVVLTHAARGTIAQGDEYRVVIRVDDNIVDRLRVNRAKVHVEGDTARAGGTRSGDELKIELENGSYSNLTLDVEIAMPNVTSLGLSGAASAEISGFAVAHAVDFDLSGASRLSGKINTGPLHCRLSGASRLQLSGIGDDLVARASGASRLQLGDFVCADADVDFSGASRGTIHIQGNLDARLTGASSLNYKGNPTLGSVSTSGASTLKDAN